jgi:replicative DNA helicase
MAEKSAILSEAEELDRFLEELQQQKEINDIAGWNSGFANLNRALDGILPGLYLLVGQPGCGKTSFAKQLLDQVAMCADNATGIFFSSSESKKELRIKTLARLSGIESREIRRGSGYLLHWYGVPRLSGPEAEELSPSWEKARRCADNARSWLDSVFLIECGEQTSAETLEDYARKIRAFTGKEKLFIVIDESQRLGAAEQPLQVRLPLLTERFYTMARNINAALLVVWPELEENGKTAPQAWAERALGADVVMVMELDRERTKKLAEHAQAINVHIVKNRGGDKGKLSFDFHAAFARFTEVS